MLAIAACILDPRFKTDLFLNDYNNTDINEQIERYIFSITKIKTYYRDNYITEEPNVEKQDFIDSQFFKEYIFYRDEFDEYLSTPVVKPNKMFDIYQYWKYSNLLNLKRFAIDLLTIPASSSSVERAFAVAAEDNVPKRRRYILKNSLNYSI